LNDYLQKFYGFSLNIKDAASGNNIDLSTKKFIKAPDNDEHYTLNGSGKSIAVQGDSYAGTFRGVQSLIQLLPVKKSASLQLPLVSISDQPRLKYRGLMLDVARHFFDVEFVKQYIDFIALHKMNTFHWHLTDDQGWRVEIKKYPKLTEVGAYRNGTIIGHYPGTGNDNIHYGGFYTQDQIRDVVDYAAKRHVTVIPEIEMPGHAKAALASYANLGCTGGPYEVKQTWGIEQDVFCAGNDSVFSFLQDVLDEVMPLFPSQYIHVGGDECPKDRWKTCPKCQKRIKDNNLKDEHELQSYFVQRIEKYINSQGKKMIGWDEILEGGLAPNATVMSWRGEAGGIEAAKQDHDVIMTPGTHVYLDHAQSKKEDSLTIGGYTSVQKVYSYEPVPPVLNAQQKKHVLGAQGNVWTEYMTNPRKVEYMIFPRLSALSEVLWTPAALKNWDDFEKRLKIQFKRYDVWGVNYSRALFTDPRIKLDPKKKIASK
jgi:hexosaminidase